MSLEVQTAPAHGSAKFTRPSAAGHEDAYVLSYGLSNAVAAERLALDDYARLVPLMPTASARIEAVNGAAMAARHLQFWGGVSRRRRIALDRGLAEPEWRSLHRHLATATARGDLAAALVIREVALAALDTAFCGLLSGCGGIDLEVASLASAVLGEKRERAVLGLWHLRSMMTGDPETVVDALRWAHHRTMRENHRKFDRPDETPCGPDNETSDAALRAARDAVCISASGHYKQALLSLFGPRIAAPLLASLASFREHIAIAAAAGGELCCSPADGVRRC